MGEHLTGETRLQVSDRLAERYREGETIAQLVADTGLSFWRVRTLLIESGVVLRSMGRRKGHFYPPNKPRTPDGAPASPPPVDVETELAHYFGGPRE